MDGRGPRSILVLTERLSRWEALNAYASPALAVVGATSLNTFGTSGQVKVEEPKSGGGNPGGGHDKKKK